VNVGKRKALGRGLSALIPDPEGDERREPSAAAEVALSELEPNPYQPRLTIDPERLAELAASIRASGIVQPILVRRRGERYQIIAGERRWRAAEAAGLASVPVSVREVKDEQLLELALVENVQRQELSPLEEAQAFQRLQGELGLSQEEIARRVGRDRTTVANTVRLLKLPRELRELLTQGKLDAGHARALLALERAEDQLALGREAARKGLSVREVERRVALLRAPRGGQRAALKEPNTAAAEERLRRALGTRVEIARRGKGGAIRVLFKSEAELQRLYELLLRAGRSR
jgi:ParB family transcriptional regulator, chromosome partitioning protein